MFLLLFFNVYIRTECYAPKRGCFVFRFSVSKTIERNEKYVISSG